MNKIKEALHIGQEKHAENKAEKEVTGTHGRGTDGLDIAKEQGRSDYEAGAPVYAGRSGTGGVAATGTTNQDDSFKAAGGMSTDTPAGGAYTGSQHVGQSKHTPGYGTSDAYGGQGEGLGSGLAGGAAGAEASRYAGNTGNNTDTFVNDPNSSSMGRSGNYDNTIGTTGATGSRGDFAANDPVSSGRSGLAGDDIYNDRTGHTHSTTGQHTNDSAFRNDPTSAATTGVVGGTTGHHHHGHHGHGHDHQTFTANRLDPAASEQIPYFHEEHMHGNKLHHGHPGTSTEQYANEHYDPSRGPDFLGRDAALGGATGAGAAGLGSGTTGTMGTGPASSTQGPHSSNLANVVDPRVQPDLNAYSQSTTGPHGSNIANRADPRVDSTTGSSNLGSTGSGYGSTGNTLGNDRHLGRDAALAGGAGALGTAAYDEHERNKPSATQRYDAGTTGLGSSSSSYQTGPDNTGSHYHHGHATSRAGDARDPTTGAVGTLPHDSLEDHMTKHELKEHEKHQRERDQHQEKHGLLGGVFGSRDKNTDTTGTSHSHGHHTGRDAALGAGAGAGTAVAAEDLASHHGQGGVSSSDYASQPAGGNFSSGNYSSGPTGTAVGSTGHTLHGGRRAGDEPFDSSTVGTGGTMSTKGYGGEDRYTSGIGGYSNSSNYNDTHTSSNNPLSTQTAGGVGAGSAVGAASGATSSGQAMGAPHDHHFGRNLPQRDPHLYDDNTNTSSGSTLSNIAHGGNSSKRRQGYPTSSTRDPASSSAYDPASSNYGSSSAIGTGSGLVDRSRADADPTTGLAGTTAHGNTSSGVTGGPSYADEGADNLQASEHQRSGLSKLLHRDNPTKLHKDPPGGYPEAGARGASSAFQQG